MDQAAAADSHSTYTPRVDNGVILTKRLQLRLMTTGDLDALLTIFTDRRVMAAFDSPPFTNEQMRAWLERNLRHQDEHGFGLFAVIERASGELIGDCGLEDVRVLADGTCTAEIGYDFRSSHWGRGLATEAAVAVRDFAFDQGGVNRLIAMVRARNERSRRVAERIGMTLDGEDLVAGVGYWRLSLDRPVSREPQMAADATLEPLC
jgi:RimJ/RimL family protein N-acetyltransferase